jgi:hypothetical protein
LTLLKMKKTNVKKVLGWIILSAVHFVGLFLISLLFLVGSAPTDESSYSLTDLQVYLRRILFVSLLSISISIFGTLIIKLFNLQPDRKTSIVIGFQIFLMTILYLVLEIIVWLFSMSS